VRLRDFVTILVVLAMTGAFIWYVTATFLLNGTALAFVLVLLLFGGLGHLITGEPARRQTILRHKPWFIATGIAVMAAVATIAIATHRLHDLTRDGFRLFIAYLPRACWWHGRFTSKRTRLDGRL
jgi:hypothetical protein